MGLVISQTLVIPIAPIFWLYEVVPLPEPNAPVIIHARPSMQMPVTRHVVNGEVWLMGKGDWLTAKGGSGIRVKGMWLTGVKGCGLWVKGT